VTRPALLLASAATVSLATIAVCAVLMAVHSTATPVVLDGDQTASDVVDILRDEHRYNAQSASCPKLEGTVPAGTTFQCTITLSGDKTEHVEVTVNSDGGYDVDPPK
jgi:Domain of unknown function (DUF4333)